MDPLAIADMAALVEGLAEDRSEPLAHRQALSDPEALLAFLERETEKVRRQVAVRRQAEAERLRELKLRGLAELAAGAAHEINNPLAVISGQAQHLLKTEESLERAKSLERIIAQCKRIHAVLTDLMFYARPPQPKPRAVNLSKILAEAKAAVAHEANERQVAVEIEPLPPRLSLQADAEMLQKAVTCLVTNGIEAAPADGWVRISAQSLPGRIEIHVDDNGPGLNAADREHLFDPFFCGRSAGRGMGLGLPKVWRIATLHGGQVRYDSTPGQPTRFTLSLPSTHGQNGTHAVAARRNGKHRRRA